MKRINDAKDAFWLTPCPDSYITWHGYLHHQWLKIQVFRQGKWKISCWDTCSIKFIGIEKYTLSLTISKRGTGRGLSDAGMFEFECLFSFWCGDAHAHNELVSWTYIFYANVPIFVFSLWLVIWRFRFWISR